MYVRVCSWHLFRPPRMRKFKRFLRTCPRRLLGLFVLGFCWFFFVYYLPCLLFWPKILNFARHQRRRCCHRRAFYEHFAMMPCDCGLSGVVCWPKIHLSLINCWPRVENKVKTFLIAVPDNRGLHFLNVLTMVAIILGL